MQILEAHKLVRMDDPIFRPEWCEFLHPFIGPISNWTIRDIKNLENVLLLYYGVCTEKQTFLVLIANLVDRDNFSKRRTQMRLHQMIISEYFAAGGDLGTLRYVGFCDIDEEDIRRSISKEFNRQGTALATGVVIVTPSSPNWLEHVAENHFVESSKYLVQELRTLTRKAVVISGIHYIVVGSSDENAQMHMVLEIGVGGGRR